jgi:hypothetical protein
VSWRESTATCDCFIHSARLHIFMLIWSHKTVPPYFTPNQGGMSNDVAEGEFTNNLSLRGVPTKSGRRGNLNLPNPSNLEIASPSA